MWAWAERDPPGWSETSWACSPRLLPCPPPAHVTGGACHLVQDKQPFLDPGLVQWLDHPPRGSGWLAGSSRRSGAEAQPDPWESGHGGRMDRALSGRCWALACLRLRLGNLAGLPGYARVFVPDPRPLESPRQPTRRQWPLWASRWGPLYRGSKYPVGTSTRHCGTRGPCCLEACVSSAGGGEDLWPPPCQV